MRYRFPDLVDKPCLARALEVGKLDTSHQFIDLPDNFDFGSEAPAPVKGLGETVAFFAKPIARAIDGVLGTDLENCQPCEDRRQEWNEKYPGT